MTMQRIDPVCGEWTNNLFLYTSRLSIKTDSTFKFHSQGCLGHKYTEGKWTKKGDNVELTSFDIYETPLLTFDSSNIYFLNSRFEIRHNMLIELNDSNDDHKVYKKLNYR